MEENTKTAFEDLVELFSPSVGVEKARDVVESAAADVGAEDGGPFSPGEVIEIATVIQQEHTGYIGIVANELRVRTQAEKRFLALLENIPDPATVIRYDGTEPVVRSVNSAFEETFGFDADAATGASINDLILPPGREADATVLDRRMVAENRVEREVTRVTADGEPREFLFRGVPVATETGEIEAYAIYTDITERKRRERELEQKNKRLEQFAGVVSHDLRNPLSVAEGRLQLARETGDDEHLDAVETALDRMGNLIDGLLALARKGQTVGETEPVDLGQVAHRAWSTVSTTQATLTVDDDLAPVRADPDRIVDLFENLFRNAIEHGGDDVAVAVGRHADGFYVADDGPGIPAEKRDEVVQHGYSSNEDGTGLGLAIVESIVEAHDWSLAITDSDHGGARFEVTGVSPVTSLQTQSSE